MSNEPIIISKKEVIRFCIDCLKAAGAKKSHAEALASVLAEGDHRGHFSHGLNRLEMYIRDLHGNNVNKNGEPKILNETISTAYVDGCNCLGPVVGNYAMQIAIEKAKKTGIGWVVAKGSNHYGIAGWYAMTASDEGMIGMSFTNTSPLVLPTRSKQQAIGTNPIAVSAPALTKSDEFVLDMATSSVALGKLEMNRRRHLPIPNGWGADSDGKVTNDPEKAIQGGLLPLGGSEETSGYKGYGLGLMVEVFCGMLSGSAYGSHVRKWMDSDKDADLGQCFAAINPDVFAPGFRDRMSTFARELRDLPRSNNEYPVLIPGDPERQHMGKCTHLGGIPYVPVLINSMDQLAQSLKVDKLKKTLKK